MSYGICLCFYLNLTKDFSKAPLPDFTLKLKCQKITVLVYAKKSDTALDIKTKLAKALNDSKVFSGDSNGITTIEDDLDDIEIPKPSFDTDDIPVPKPSFATNDDKDTENPPSDNAETEPEEILVEDIRLAIPTKAADGAITGYTEFSDKEKLAGITGFRDRDVLAFVVSPEDEFEITVMLDDEGDEE